MWTKSSKRNNNPTGFAHEQWEKLRQCQTHAHFPDSTEKGHKQTSRRRIDSPMALYSMQHAVENGLDVPVRPRQREQAPSHNRARGKPRTLTKAKVGKHVQRQRRVGDWTPVAGSVVPRSRSQSPIDDSEICVESQDTSQKR